MSRIKNKLTEKELLFCTYFARDGDARGCAARAGYTLSPRRSAEKLLAREEIREEISRLEKEKAVDVSLIAKGLERLAFGSSADAVKLMMSEETLTSAEIERLDLFNVSDIKRPKGGGLEIKFFDRLKALEKLGSLGGGTESGESSFVAALSEGAKLLSQGEED